MNNDRELLQQALDALDVATTPLARDRQEVLQAQAALRARLAQPEPEPVAWMHIHGSHEDPCFCELTEDEISQGWTQKPLYYTAPPQREWQGLTKEELAEIAEFHFHGALSGREFYDDVEAKLKEKNT